MHDIDVLWWFYDYEGCEFKTKLNGNITTHKANKHNIGIKWKQCPHCDHKAKSTGDLTQHKAMKHNVGVQWKQCPHCEHKSKKTGEQAHQEPAHAQVRSTIRSFN